MSSCEVDIIQHVLRNRSNYYRILMLDRNASSSDIKSAYRKMALRCHPDKCTHAHAAEAFKLVGTAYATLSDATKRRVYDAQGADGVQRHESRGMRRPNTNGGATTAGGRGGYANARQHDFFQEFFFGNGNQFFTTNGMNAQTQGFHFQRRDDGYERVDLSGSCLMLLPILLFLLLAILLQSSMTDFAFAQGSGSGNSGVSGSGGASTGVDTRGGGGTWLGGNQRRRFAIVPEPDEGIIHERVTSMHGLRVKYYVTQAWKDVLQRRRDALISTERQVLRSQRDYLGNRCQAERMKYQKRGVLSTPRSCSEYEQFTRVLR